MLHPDVPEAVLQVKARAFVLCSDGSMSQARSWHRFMILALSRCTYTHRLWQLQAYLKQLLKAANSRREGSDVWSHARVAIRCLCVLLASLHHFNYASDLLQVGSPAWILDSPGCIVALKGSVRCGEQSKGKPVLKGMPPCSNVAGAGSFDGRTTLHLCSTCKQVLHAADAGSSGCNPEAYLSCDPAQVIKFPAKSE